MTTDAAAFSFEGEDVTEFTAQLPSAKLEAPEAYPRGTLLTLSVQVRVKSVRIDSDRHDNLVRNHILALEECNITDVLTPAQRAELVAAAEMGDTARTVWSTSPAPAQTLQEQVATQAAAQSDHADFDPTDVDLAGLSEAEEDDLDVETDQETIKPVDPDDNDPEHAWMDADDDHTLHVVVQDQEF